MSSIPPGSTTRNGVLIVAAVALLSQLPTTVASIPNPTTRALFACAAGLALLGAGYLMTPPKKRDDRSTSTSKPPPSK